MRTWRNHGEKRTVLSCGNVLFAFFDALLASSRFVQDCWISVFYMLIELVLPLSKFILGWYFLLDNISSFCLFLSESMDLETWIWVVAENSCIWMWYQGYILSILALYIILCWQSDRLWFDTLSFVAFTCMCKCKCSRTARTIRW